MWILSMISKSFWKQISNMCPKFDSASESTSKNKTGMHHILTIIIYRRSS